MLVQTKEHHLKAESVGALGSRSKFLTTTRLLQLFSSNLESPTDDMRIVYIDGAWDMVSPSNSQCSFLANPFFGQLMNISISRTAVSPWSCDAFKGGEGGEYRYKLVLPFFHQCQYIIFLSSPSTSIHIFCSSVEIILLWAFTGMHVSIK